MIKVVGLLLVAAIATYGLHAIAQIRADVRPSMTPIGSSSSNGISFAVSVKLLGILWNARRRRPYSSVVVDKDAIDVLLRVADISAGM